MVYSSVLAYTVWALIWSQASKQVMPKVYLKEADNPSRTEVSVESVEDLAVKDFRETASEKLDIPLDELCECCLESLENVICYILYVCLDLPAEGQIVS